MSIRPLESLPPTETLEIENGLSLVPRVKLMLTIQPSLPSSATKRIDEWKLKQAIIGFLKTSLSVSITVPEEDLEIKRFKDLKKRKRDDPVAQGSLCIRDLGFLDVKNGSDDKDQDAKFLDWRKHLVEKLDGIQLNLEGTKYLLAVAVPASDDFESMKTAWQEFYAFKNRGYSRGGRQEPDTIIMTKVPSRWFAEPRVSSKPSMLVTHTIFSTFGNIRNLNISEDNDQNKGGDEDDGLIIPGLHCKVIVQFEKHRDFYNALKVLCGRSLQKQGSRLKADYEVTWDMDGFFQNSRSQTQEKSRTPGAGRRHYMHELPRYDSHFSRHMPDNARRKRFKE